MIFVFTYHKVRGPDAAGDKNFYTISAAQLERQIGTLRERGCTCMPIEDLIGLKTVPDKKFVLTFDDGTEDHLRVVVPLLQKHSCQGVFFIPTANLNKPGFLTNAQVQEIAKAGHAIGFHSHEHRRLDVLPREEIRRQIALSQKIIGDIVGHTPVLFVPPGGFVNTSVREAALDVGVKVMRTMRWGYNHNLDPMALETIPVNQYTNDRKFQKILESRSAPLVYACKEALKRLIPLPSYEFLRRLLFKFSKPD